jgi:quercetin dioxygenase-like cupin family protein
MTDRRLIAADRQPQLSSQRRRCEWSLATPARTDRRQIYRSYAAKPGEYTMKTIDANKPTCRVDNGCVIRAFGQEAHVLVSSEQTGDAFYVLRFFIPPGNVTPPHLHRATDETFLIESGEIEIIRGGELLRGRKGDVIYLPKAIPHALRVIGNEEGVALVVSVVPGGFDRFFAACAEEFKKGEPEMPLVVKLAAEYGIEFQSGPPS